MIFKSHMTAKVERCGGKFFTRGFLYHFVKAIKIPYPNMSVCIDTTKRLTAII